MKHDVDGIADIALDLLNEVGLEGLSTRRLAIELDVKGPALYHYFRNKNELLDHMAAAMLSATLAQVGPQPGWEGWLTGLGHETRQMILRYRDGARLLSATSPMGPARARLFPLYAQPLVDAGFSRGEAGEAVGMMQCLVLGWTLHEQDAAMHQHMTEIFNVEAAFHNSLEAMVVGLAVRRGLRTA